MAFELPQLGYAHDALEPHFDARTMEIHHGKHHAGYTSKLNAAVEGTDMECKSIEELLANHSDNAAIRNNGGGYYNQAHPEPKRVAAAALNFSFSPSSEPKASSIAAANSPVGAPPPFGESTSQNKQWL